MKKRSDKPVTVENVQVKFMQKSIEKRAQMTLSLSGSPFFLKLNTTNKHAPSHRYISHVIIPDCLPITRG